MKTIQVGFSDGGNPFSKLIKWVTGSKVSHTFIKLNVAGVDVVYQASGLCINHENYDLFLDHEVVVELYEASITEEDWEEQEKRRWRSVGRAYGWKEVIGFVWVLAWRRLGRKVKNPFYDGQHGDVCVDETAWHIGIEGDGTWTPEDLRHHCERNLKRVK